MDYFCKLKKLFSIINPEYSKPLPNDSQEFGIDLINYLITKNKEPVDEIIEEEQNYISENDFIKTKKIILKNYISTYQNKTNNQKKCLYLIKQIIFYNKNKIIPNISSYLHLELTLPKNSNSKLIDLLEQKFKIIDDKYLNNINNQIIIKSKIINLPQILIISINRVLNNERINNNQISFEESLDLKNCIDLDLFNDNNKKTSYHLYAVNMCTHFLKSSHYFCYIKIENNWFLFDDNKTPKRTITPNNYSSVVGLFYLRDS